MKYYENYTLGEQAKVMDAITLGYKIENSIGIKEDGINEKNVCEEIADMYMKNDTPVDLILKSIGEAVKDEVTEYFSAEKEKPDVQEKYRQVYENAKFDYSVDDDNRLNFTLNCNGTEYQIEDNFSVTSAINYAVGESYNLSDKEKIADAVLLCRQMKEEFEGYFNNFDPTDYALEAMKDGVSVHNIVREISTEIFSAVEDYIDNEWGFDKEDYLDNFFQGTMLNTYVENDKIEMELQCDTLTYPVTNGAEIKDIISDSLEKFIAEHEEFEEEEEEFEYD